ncbi:putative serine protease family S33 [Phytophthora cinnamomi]|uniref:putative serine protease family S33 n=1 Tax=Phytophthora cinnamomi TaxID=4785 RepID=UPI00355A828A|nr:putative serine protease family S33 [Phytophthora cinnamomi]
MGNVCTRAFALVPPHHQRRSRWLLALILLYLGKKLLGPTLMSILLRWHYARTAETPRLIYRKTPANKKLLSHCVTMTQTKYYPPWRLFNGHLQTIKFAFDKRAPQINYKRQLLDMPDGGVVSLDWALLPGHCPAEKEGGVLPHAENSSWIEGVDPTRRTALLLPGLTGGSPANYVRFTVARLHELSKKYDFGQEAFVGVGFSMGSNVLVKYLGEEGDQTPLTGAISVGNPFNLTKVSENLSGTLFNRLLYDKMLNRSKRALFFEKSNAAEMFEGYPGLDMEAVRASRTVREFDDTLTSVLFNYKNADEFYQDASSDKKLRAVKVPLLCINAEDDPISVRTALPSRTLVESCPNVILCVTKSGGHLAYYESSLRSDEEINGRDGNDVRKSTPTMWTAKPIAEFAEAVRLGKVTAANAA